MIDYWFHRLFHQLSYWSMLFYKRHFGAFSFTNIILVHVVLIMSFWCMLFYKRQFGACYFINVILVHVLLLMTFEKSLPQKIHFKNCFRKKYISKLLSQKILYKICFFKTLYLFFIRIITRRKIAQIFIKMSN